MHFTDTFGSRSTHTARGTHLPAPVSQKKKVLSRTSIAFSDGLILPAGCRGRGCIVSVATSRVTCLASTRRNALLKSEVMTLTNCLKIETIVNGGNRPSPFAP
jgi:hypothetical protein